LRRGTKDSLEGGGGRSPCKKERRSNLASASSSSSTENEGTIPLRRRRGEEGLELWRKKNCSRGIHLLTYFKKKDAVVVILRATRRMEKIMTFSAKGGKESD